MSIIKKLTILSLFLTLYSRVSFAAAASDIPQQERRIQSVEQMISKKYQSDITKMAEQLFLLKSQDLEFDTVATLFGEIKKNLLEIGIGIDERILDTIYLDLLTNENYNIFFTSILVLIHKIHTLHSALDTNRFIADQINMMKSSMTSIQEENSKREHQHEDSKEADCHEDSKEADYAEYGGNRNWSHGCGCGAEAQSTNIDREIGRMPTAHRRRKHKRKKKKKATQRIPAPTQHQLTRIPPITHGENQMGQYFSNLIHILRELEELLSAAIILETQSDSEIKQQVVEEINKLITETINRMSRIKRYIEDKLTIELTDKMFARSSMIDVIEKIKTILNDIKNKSVISLETACNIDTTITKIDSMKRILQGQIEEIRRTFTDL